MGIVKEGCGFTQPRGFLVLLMDPARPLFKPLERGLFDRGDDHDCLSDWGSGILQVRRCHFPRGSAVKLFRVACPGPVMSEN